MQDNTAAPLPDPIVIPTVSAWSRQESSSESPGTRPMGSPQGLAAIPLAAVLVLALSYVGFAGIFAYLIVVSNNRIDRETDALDRKIGKLEEFVREIKQEQSLRKEHVLRIPSLGDTINGLQRDVAEYVGALRLTESLVRANREEVEKLRRDHDLLLARLNDLTYVRQPRIPVPEGPQ
jgi:hypothetical protein